jgi:hypothetical protein
MVNGELILDAGYWMLDAGCWIFLNHNGAKDTRGTKGILHHKVTKGTKITKRKLLCDFFGRKNLKY